ncbi:putative lipoprotein [Myxococcus stipitatus DSM 14675]|uniref:Putative lipoprotein n=1 Tax=Myxococcus stipitatus (strain DSM 14675 / JCM 12634 / Mx s8) TaxID=1278073 RepID=L7UJD5_MYXSD|nr:putative lipoprotein [Myxococcus stipitatus]AGC49101.1 putative lipoprotein [Myxococcus stipitatus DSM 14675]
MDDRSHQRRWWALLLAGGVLAAGCGGGEESGGGGIGPSAGVREKRSALWRDLVASREKPPDPQALKGPDEQGIGRTEQGRPAPSGSVKGYVAWVGDNELLIRDTQGKEQDVGVVPDTELRLNGKPVGLASMREGDSVEATYDDGPGGWVAREVVVRATSEPPPPSNERGGAEVSP